MGQREHRCEVCTENPAITRPSRRCNGLKPVDIPAIPRRTVYRVSAPGPHPYALGDAMVNGGTEHKNNKTRHRLRRKAFMVSPAGFEPATPGLEEPHSGVYGIARMSRSPWPSTNSGLRISILSLLKWPVRFVVTPW